MIRPPVESINAEEFVASQPRSSREMQVMGFAKIWRPCFMTNQANLDPGMHQEFDCLKRPNKNGRLMNSRPIDFTLQLGPCIFSASLAQMISNRDFIFGRRLGDERPLSIADLESTVCYLTQPE